jgi:hypothetical protein
MALSTPFFLILIVAASAPRPSDAFSTPAGQTSSSSSSSSSSFSRRARSGPRRTFVDDARGGGGGGGGGEGEGEGDIGTRIGVGGGDSRASAVPMPSRRRALASAAATAANLLVAGGGSSAAAASAPMPSVAAAAAAAARPPEGGRAYVGGRITLRSTDLLDDVIAASSSVGEKSASSSYALYVTARPSVPDNVPAAILDGSRGRPPPVLSARYANPTFPFDFELSSADLTLEGGAFAASAIADDGGGGARGDVVWWAGEDLVVSARLDTDGIASTRDRTDLVGRGVFRPSPLPPSTTTTAIAPPSGASAASVVSIELRGRGMFGKSVTARK